MSGNTAEAITQVTSVAGPIALTAWNSVSDFLIVIVLVGVFVLFSRYVGRGPFVGVILSFYTAYAVYAVFPYDSYLPSAPAITALATRVGFYLALVFVFYVIMRRVVVSDFLDIGSLSLILLSFLTAGLLLSLAYHVFPVASVYHFTPALDMLFAAKTYFFFWFIAPAIGLFFLAH
ncbi:MAG: hypothetical protein RLZZ26_369 [Candidatus Parcubacteria bacterium]|jgi:hypothetical protein